MTTQKEIAQHLDRAAQRCESVGGSAATSKQCWFLAKLLLDAGEDARDIDCGPANTQAMLTKSKASLFIDQLIKQNAA